MATRMLRRQLGAALAATLLALSTSAKAVEERSLVGSWFAEAVPTTVPRPPVKDLITFTRDGTVVESQRLYLKDTPWGPLLRTPGAGEWRRTGDRTFAVTLLVIYQGVPDHPTIPGEVFAIEEVRMRLTRAPDGDRLAGTLFDGIRDTSGAIIFAGPGTYKASRIRVEPLP